MHSGWPLYDLLLRLAETMRIDGYAIDEHIRGTKRDKIWVEVADAREKYGKEKVRELNPFFFFHPDKKHHCPHTSAHNGNLEVNILRRALRMSKLDQYFYPEELVGEQPYTDVHERILTRFRSNSTRETTGGLAEVLAEGTDAESMYPIDLETLRANPAAKRLIDMMEDSPLAELLEVKLRKQRRNLLPSCALAQAAASVEFLVENWLTIPLSEIYRGSPRGV